MWHTHTCGSKVLLLVGHQAGQRHPCQWAVSPAHTARRLEHTQEQDRVAAALMLQLNCYFLSELHFAI